MAQSVDRDRPDSLAILRTADARSGRGFFVGRQREMSTLLNDLQATEVGRGRLALLMGGAGMGKTQVASELAKVAERSGVRVVWTRCEDRAPEGSPSVQVRGAKTVAGEGIRAIGPEPRDSPGLTSIPALLAAAAAAAEPLLLVIDDLQLADDASLRAVGLLGTRARDMPMLIVGAYRDMEVARRPGVLAFLGQLPTETLRLPLGALSEAEVSSLIEMYQGEPTLPAVSARIRSVTRGNPFFVTELVRLLVAEHQLLGEGASAISRGGKALPMPSAIRETMAARLNVLSVDCVEAMAAASVIGYTFELGLLRAATSLTWPTLLAAIDEATTSGLVVPRDADRYQFYALLVQEAIYERLEPGRRLALHAAIGEAIERLSPASGRPPHSLIAYHLLRSDPGVYTNKTLKATVLAGAESRAAGRFDEAESWYSAALRIALEGDTPATQRCDVLLALGEVQSATGQVDKARDTFLAAVDLSRMGGTADQFARAVIGVGGRFVRLDSAVDDHLIALLEEALARVDNNPSLRATLLARLSRALHNADAPGRRTALSLDALTLARQTKNVDAQIAALHSRYWALSGADDFSERLAVATEMVELAVNTGDLEMALQGHHWRLLQLAEAGDIASTRAEVRDYCQLADRLRQPLYMWFSLLLRAMISLLDGKLDDAEAFVRQALMVGENNHNAAARRYFAAQLFLVRREQGRLDELSSEIGSFYLDTTSLARTKAALINCISGRRDTAEAEFRILAARDFADLPRNMTWITQMTMLAEMCRYIGDARRAEQLYEMLLPFRERNVVIGAAMACGGAVSHFLGLLATTCGRRAEALKHFEHAIAFNERNGLRCPLVHTQYEYARVLAEAPAGEDTDRAFELVNQAAATAQQIGMGAVVHDARALQARIGTRRRPPNAGEQMPPNADAVGTESEDVDVFRLDGDFWTVQYEGTLRVMRDTKGLHYLRHLLGHPGREFHVVDLALLTADASSTEQTWPPQIATSGRIYDEGFACNGELTEDLIDSEARRRYRQRIRDLQDDLAEAQCFHDHGRIARCEDEIELLTAELTSRYNKGTAVRWDSTSERIRKAVTNRIRAAIRKLDREQPVLGNHLNKTIRTGTFCIYSPERPRRWTL